MHDMARVMLLAYGTRVTIVIYARIMETRAYARALYMMRRERATAAEVASMSPPRYRHYAYCYVAYRHACADTMSGVAAQRQRVDAVCCLLPLRVTLRRHLMIFAISTVLRFDAAIFSRHAMSLTALDATLMPPCLRHATPLRRRLLITPPLIRYYALPVVAAMPMPCCLHAALRRFMRYAATLMPATLDDASAMMLCRHAAIATRAAAAIRAAC